jgi:uncharacterized membrane protein YeaQ/YmgE (transglycosylase-associated protein family)
MYSFSACLGQPTKDSRNKEESMYLFAWIFVGVVVGWVAGKGLQGNEYGSAMDVTMGIGGPVAGGFLINAAGIPGYPGIILSTFVALVCAVLLTNLVAVVNGRRTLVREL